MPRVYIPGPLQVNFPASEAYPTGRVVGFVEGYADLTDEMLKNPILAKLVPQTEEAVARQEALFKAKADHEQAVAEADQALLEARIEAQTGANEEMAAKVEEWAAAKEAALASGVQFNEPHPDPEQQRAIALTTTVPVSTTPGAMEQKPDNIPPEMHTVPASTTPPEPPPAPIDPSAPSDIPPGEDTTTSSTRPTL